jgi:hypothetical protein
VDQYTLKPSIATGRAELGSAQTTFKQPRVELRREVDPQDLSGSGSGMPTAFDNIGLGIVQEPRIIGYDKNCHWFVPHSLVKYRKHVKDIGKFPEWMQQMQDWIKGLQDRRLPVQLVVGSKTEWPLGAHLMFYALPTGFRPHETSKKVPSWNQWEMTLPFHFFKAASALLSNSGLLALVYPDGTFTVASVNESMKQAEGFQYVCLWTVILDKAVYSADGLVLVSLCSTFSMF